MKKKKKEERKEEERRKEEKLRGGLEEVSGDLNPSSIPQQLILRKERNGLQFGLRGLFL